MSNLPFSWTNKALKSSSDSDETSDSHLHNLFTSMLWLHQTFNTCLDRARHPKQLSTPNKTPRNREKKFRKFSTWHRRAADDDDIDLVQVQAEAQSPSWWDDDEVVWNLISLSPLLFSSTCLFDSTFTCYRSCMPYTSTRKTKTTHHNMKISPFFISSLLMSEVLCLLLVWNCKKHVNFFREAEAEN